MDLLPTFVNRLWNESGNTSLDKIASFVKYLRDLSTLHITKEKITYSIRIWVTVIFYIVTLFRLIVEENIVIRAWIFITLFGEPWCLVLASGVIRSWTEYRQKKYITINKLLVLTVNKQHYQNKDYSKNTQRNRFSRHENKAALYFYYYIIFLFQRETVFVQGGLSVIINKCTTHVINIKHW